MGCPQAEPGRVAGPWLDGARQHNRTPLGKVPFQFGSLSSAADKGSPLLTAGICKERAVIFHREKARSLVPGLPRLHPLCLFTGLYLIHTFCGKTIIVSKNIVLSSKDFNNRKELDRLRNHGGSSSSRNHHDRRN